MMTDLEATRLCAEAMGWKVSEFKMTSPKRTPSAIGAYDNPKENTPVWYDPLHDDAQCMALVKRFHLHTIYVDNVQRGDEKWKASPGLGKGFTTMNADLNRAVVYCVAKMQAAKIAPIRDRTHDA